MSVTDHVHDNLGPENEETEYETVGGTEYAYRTMHCSICGKPSGKNVLGSRKVHENADTRTKVD